MQFCVALLKKCRARPQRPLSAENGAVRQRSARGQRRESMTPSRSARRLPGAARVPQRPGLSFLLASRLPRPWRTLCGTVTQWQPATGSEPPSLRPRPGRSGSLRRVRVRCARPDSVGPGPLRPPRSALTEVGTLSAARACPPACAEDFPSRAGRRPGRPASLSGAGCRWVDGRTRMGGWADGRCAASVSSVKSR